MLQKEIPDSWFNNGLVVVSQLLNHEADLCGCHEFPSHYTIPGSFKEFADVSTVFWQKQTVFHLFCGKTSVALY